MPDISVNIEIFCARCGAGICNNATSGKTQRRGEPFFSIEPCEACLDKAFEAGRDKGYDEGQAASEG